MIEPPPDRRNSGIAALVPRNTPFTLTSITRSHSSTVVSSTFPVPPIPALFTRTSSLLKRARVAATACCHSASLVTSNLRKRHSPPVSLISVLVLCPSSSSTSPMTTLAPSLANNLAIASPMPLAPPLIKATLSFSLIVFLHR